MSSRIPKMEVTIDNVRFKEVPDKRQGVKIGSILTLSNVKMSESVADYINNPDDRFYTLVNAVDIDWNAVVVDDNLELHTTSDLIKWIKSLAGGGIDPSNYYDKEEIDAKVTELNQADTDINNAIGTDSTPNTIKGRIKSIEESYVSDNDLSDYTYDKNTIDEKVAQGGTFDPEQYYNKQATDQLLNAKADSNSLSDVATSGSYNDLSDKPTIPDAQVLADWNEANTSNKSYIKNKPNIPTVPTNVSAFNNDAGYLASSDIAGKADKSDTYTKAEVDASQQAQDTAIAAKAPQATTYTKTEVNNLLSPKANSADLATVATSGSYNDLTDKPTIPDAQIQADWNQTTTTAKDYIKNKPNIPTKTSDLVNDSSFITSSDIPEGAAASNTMPKEDGNASTGSELAFARGDHRHPHDSTKADISSLANVATSGSYNDLNDKPSIPDALIQSDWSQNITTAKDYIKNKPNLAAVATSGSFTDLTNKPTYTKSDVGLGNVLNVEQIPATDKGIAGGVATLDSTGKVPSSQLPSYVDDVIEAASRSAFPIPGEAGKIYIAKDTNKEYRWGGSDYAVISETLAIGETSSSAFAGDRGKAVEDKLATIANGAEVNVQADWTESDNTKDSFILHKPTIPTKTSLLTNDSNFITDADIPEGAAASNTTPKEATDGGNKGTENTFARGDHRHPHDSTKLDVINGNNKLDASLVDDTESTNKFVTSSEKSTWNNKLNTISDLQTIRNGASAGATAVQPGDLATVATSGDYNDLTNKPSIPAAQIQSDWNQTTTTSKDYIKNKPTIPTKTSELTNDSGYITSVPVTSVAGKTGNVTLNSSDVGLGNVGNFKAVSTDASQGLSSTEQSNARANIGAGTSSFSGSYNDLTNKPTIPCADKSYAPLAHSGLGRKTLQLKSDGSNILTQEDFSDANTIYVVQYDFDLNSGTIDVPEGCEIAFEGGSINNGTFKVNGATISGNPKGTALYGVGYKEGFPLLQNYKTKKKISSTYDMAYITYTISDVVYTKGSSQAICVTDDYVIIVGNNNEAHEIGVFTLFDRKFNFIGQCFCEDIAHGAGATIVGDKIYIATGLDVEYVLLSDVVTACQNSTRNSIPNISASYEYLFEHHVQSIDYDPERDEFAMFYTEKVDAKDYGHCFLWITDRNLNIKRAFDIDLNAYVTTHFAGSCSDVGEPEDYRHKGTFGDLVYKNGIIISPFWYAYNYSNDVFENSAYIEIDANTGTPVAFLGNIPNNSGITECEGICFNPDDSEEYWVLNQESFNVLGVERHTGTFIGRISFTKEVDGIVLPYTNTTRANAYSVGSRDTVHVDNSWRKFSTGNHLAPFKSLETAFLLTANIEKVRFIIHANVENKPYLMNSLTIGSRVMFEGAKYNDVKPIIDKARIKVDGGIFEIKDIIMTFNKAKESAIIELFNGGSLVVTDVDFASDKDIEHISAVAPNTSAILLSSGTQLALAGNVSFTGITIPIYFHTGGSLNSIETVTLRYCSRCYRFKEVEYICDGSISAIQSDETVTRYYTQDEDTHSHPHIFERLPQSVAGDENAIAEYCATVMAKCINNPGLVTFVTQGISENHYGSYVYTYKYGLRRTTDNFLDKPESHDNMLLGTAWLEVINNNNIETRTNKKWRKVGADPVPSAVDVDVAQYPLVSKGMYFNVYNQVAAKEFLMPMGDGWYACSFLAKGIGRIRIRLVIAPVGGGTSINYDYQLEINHDAWKPYTYVKYIPNINKSANHVIHFKLLDYEYENLGVTIAAMKLEAASSATAWSPNLYEYPTGGTTDNRPNGVPVGYQYFDTNLNKCIVWNGTAWVNLDGTPLI